MRAFSPWLLLAAATGLVGCNSYAMFRVTGFQQANFSNKADILFVLDNSSSTQDNATNFALNFNSFIDELTSSTGATTAHNTLGDAVANYIRETSGDSLFIDYQIGLTTTTVQPNDPNNLAPGDEGTFVSGQGAAADTPAVITRDDPNAKIEFQRNTLCGATCFDSTSVPSDNTFVCPTDGSDPDPLGIVSSEYLDCLCGKDNWKGHCGSGNEMGLEGGLLAMCRASDSPPDACYNYADPQGSSTPKPTVLTGGAGDASGTGFLRADANTIVVIITDEGDSSYRQATGDFDGGVYTDAYESFANPTRVAVIGPWYDDQSSGDCLGGAQPWAIERYQNVVAATFGEYVDLTQGPDAACAPSDFGTSLQQIGSLLQNLQTMFPLQQVPDVSTIDVYVDGQSVPASILQSGSVLTNDAVWGDGWTYEAAYNAVEFWGTAIPQYNAAVRIYYRPIGGFPRELPSGF